MKHLDIRMEPVWPPAPQIARPALSHRTRRVDTVAGFWLGFSISWLVAVSAVAIISIISNPLWFVLFPVTMVVTNVIASAYSRFLGLGYLVAGILQTVGACVYIYAGIVAAIKMYGC